MKTIDKFLESNDLYIIKYKTELLFITKEQHSKLEYYNDLYSSDELEGDALEEYSELFKEILKTTFPNNRINIEYLFNLAVYE